MNSQLEKLKKIVKAEEVVTEEKEEPKSLFFDTSTEKWADVAEPFKEFVREERVPGETFVKPKTNDREAYDQKIQILKEFFDSPKAAHLHLKISDSGSNAIIHQGSVNDAWARIDRKGNLKIYRTMLSRVLKKAGIITELGLINHPGV